MAHITEVTPNGWRRNLMAVLVDNAPAAAGEWRRGYLTALYALEANVLPSAYIRSWDTEAIQASIHAAIRELTLPPIEYGERVAREVQA